MRLVARARSSSSRSLPTGGTSRSVLSAVLLTTLLMCGCGVRKPVIEGRITLDGTLVRKGAIQLIPEDGKGQTAGTGVVDGRYRMEASPGTMKVIVNWPQANGKMRDPGGSGQMIDRYVESVPPRYNEQTELRVTVKPGVNVADFTLEGSTLQPTDDK
jgi:hypothetical protein